MGFNNKSNNLAMKQLVMVRVLGHSPYKKPIEIDINKFQYKYRLLKEAIGTLDGIDVAICIDDYKEFQKQQLIELMRLDEEAGLYNIEE
jgi:hypothetical protein